MVLYILLTNYLQTTASRNVKPISAAGRAIASIKPFSEEGVEFCAV